TCTVSFLYLISSDRVFYSFIHLQSSTQKSPRSLTQRSASYLILSGPHSEAAHHATDKRYAKEHTFYLRHHFHYALYHDDLHSLFSAQHLLARNLKLGKESTSQETAGMAFYLRCQISWSEKIAYNL
ncbi:hypothetical protein Tco_1091129, partial [Tanacetum coccineum]